MKLRKVGTERDSQWLAFRKNSSMIDDLGEDSCVTDLSRSQDSLRILRRRSADLSFLDDADETSALLEKVEHGDQRSARPAAGNAPSVPEAAHFVTKWDLIYKLVLMLPT